jgi:hypothetical protein
VLRVQVGPLHGTGQRGQVRLLGLLPGDGSQLLQGRLRLGVALSGLLTVGLLGLGRRGDRAGEGRGLLLAAVGIAGTPAAASLALC